MTTEQRIDLIKDKLTQLEAEVGCKVIFAAVGGSRAYGLQNIESDCDARFIFVYPKDRYLDIDDPPDYIDFNTPGLSDDLRDFFRDSDLTGYDLRKFFKIARKSGFNTLELVNSPHVIVGQYTRPILKELAGECLDPKRLIKAFVESYHNEEKRFERHCNTPGSDHRIVKSVVASIRFFLMASCVYAMLENNIEVEYPPVDFDKLLDKAFLMGLPITNSEYHNNEVAVNCKLPKCFEHFAHCKRAMASCDTNYAKLVMSLLKTPMEFMSEYSDGLKSKVVDQVVNNKMSAYFKKVIAG